MMDETPELQAFRAETRAWLEENCPAEMRTTPGGDDDIEWGSGTWREGGSAEE